MELLGDFGACEECIPGEAVHGFVEHAGFVGHDEEEIVAAVSDVEVSEGTRLFALREALFGGGQ